MRRPSWRWAWACVAALAACGGSEGEDSSSRTTAATETSGGTNPSTTRDPSETETENETETAPTPRADLGFEPPEVCTDYCTASAECLGVEESDCLLTCDSEVEERELIGEACRREFEAARACAGELSCSEFAEYQAGQGDYPCSAEDHAADLGCALGEDPPAAICEDFCATVTGCGASEATACAATCAEIRASAQEIGPDCVSAQDDVLACAAGLECDAFGSWQDGAVDAACQAEGEAIAEVCFGEE